jgi:hypothetical protein
MPFSCATSSRRAGNFFELLDCSGGLGVMARAGGELAVAKRTQHAADRLCADRDLEFLPNPLRQIGQPSAHDAMHGGYGAVFNRLRQRPLLCLVQPGRRTRGLAVDQAVPPFRVEPRYPVSDNLQPDAADPRRVGARATFVNDRQSQQATRLVRVARLSRKQTKITCCEVPAEREGGGHGEHPAGHHGENHIPLRVGKPICPPCVAGLARPGERTSVATSAQCWRQLCQRQRRRAPADLVARLAVEAVVQPGRNPALARLHCQFIELARFHGEERG